MSDDSIQSSVQRLLGARHVQWNRLRAAANAQVYRAETDAGTFFVKVGPHVIAEKANLAQIQAPEDPKHALPEVVAHDEARGILIFRYENGANLLRTTIKGANVLAYPFRRRALLRDMASAGRWLASFHAVNSLGERAVADEEKSVALARIDELGNWFSETEQSQLRETIRKADIRRASVSPTNHDFAPRNILLEGDRVVVVDWDKLIEKPVYYSIAYFMSNVESRARSMLFRFSNCCELSRHFFFAYNAQSEVQLDPDQLAVHRFFYFIEYLHGYEKKTGVFEPWKHSTGAMDRYMRRYVKPFLLNK